MHLWGGGTSGETYKGDAHTVVYHPYIGDKPQINTDFNEDLEDNVVYSRNYYGSVVSTEYNPQVWTVTDEWFPVKSYSVSQTLVFAGWSYNINNNLEEYSEPMLPGDVISSEDLKSATVDGKIHVYANWDYVKSYSKVEQKYWRYYTCTTTGYIANGNVYTNILENGYVLSASNISSILNGLEGPVTVRGGTIQLGSGNLVLGHDTIIDSLTLTGSFSTSRTHGDDSRGLFAGGNALVIGERIRTGDGTSNNDYPQVFGGSNGGVVSSTKVILHTGTYGNLIAGSLGGTITGDTFMVVKDVHVLDTLIAASSSTGKVNGSTYIYATSLEMHGDYYEESELDHSYSGAGQTKGVVLTESTILTGGSNNGIVGGSTHVFISGDSVLWDVQGAGRRGQSEVTDTSHVEVSGKAWIKHVVCGSITDGLDGSNSGVGESNECVKNTSIKISDSARVCSVFGAGYDTFYKATYSSMYNGGTIDITLEDGCIVGYVYGGGYRGTIGSTDGKGTDIRPIDSIHISINGGTVLRDVFAGGRGGVDKICHNTDGSLNWGSSNKDSTGFSKVFVDEVVLTVNGGMILGDLYGGGESVPIIGSGYTYETGVATMECGTITINILEGSKIEGAIHGGGKGVSSVVGEPDIILMNSDGEIVSIPWLKDNPSYSTYDSRIYAEYAKVHSSFIHLDILNADGVGDVFGGGAYGVVDTYGIYLNIGEGTRVNGTVFGGGMGSEKDSVLGTVVSDVIRMSVSGATIDSGNRGYALMGGGAYSSTHTDSLNITISGASSKIIGDIHAGGLGYENPDGTLPTMMDAKSVQMLLDGSIVSGSIYGGSRLGDDRPSDSVPVIENYTDTYILVTSGTITQSIYGGGFQGRSYSNSHIYIGSPAFDYLGTEPQVQGGHDHVALTLLVHNVYGGGNLSGGEAYVQSLLQGDVDIRIGGTFDDGMKYRMGPEIIDGEKTHVMCIHGNIYGDGNYSTIGGDSSVIIEGYDQYRDHSIWSIQRSDRVTISDSHLEIRGATDGGSTILSQEVSINRVGTLVLSEDSHLELHSETSYIGSYISSTDGTTPTVRADCTYDDGKLSGNRITMHGGRMFSVLGNDNRGYIDSNSDNIRDIEEAYAGLVSGFTILSVGDDNSYFGAYATASLGTDTSIAGFMVVSGNVLMDASVIDGDGVSNVTRTWYVIGHIEIGRTWTFEQGIKDSVETWAVKDSFNIPRMGGENTVFAYNGMVNNPLSLGTLLLVNPNDYNKFASDEGFNPIDDVGGRMFFGLTLSGNILNNGSDRILKSHSLISDSGWIRESFSQYDILGGGINITFDSELLSYDHYGGPNHLGSSGVVGSINISFLEMVEYSHVSGEVTTTTYLPVNMVDVEITLYVEPRDVSGNNEVQLSTVVNVMSDGEGNTGVGYIILPSTGFMTDYSVRWYSDTFTKDFNADVGFYSDDQYLNQLGWIMSSYDSDPLMVLDDGTNMTGDVQFGKGGIRPSVIRVEYSGGVVNGESLDVHINSVHDSGETSYHVHIIFQEAGNVKITVKYSPVYDGGFKTLSFTDIGGSLTTEWMDDDHHIEIPYGGTLGSSMFVIGGDQKDLLSIMNDSIKQIPTDKFDYVLYFHGWYLDTGHTRQFNPSDAVREDTILYAGFGITVRFHGDGVSVAPQTVTIEPGTSLNDNGLYNIEDEISDGHTGVKPYAGTGDDRTGYKLHEFEGSLSWAFMNNGTFAGFGFNQPLYSDHDGDSIIDLYLPWVPYAYGMTIDITNDSPEGSKVVEVNISDNVVENESTVYEVGYETDVSVSFNHNISNVSTTSTAGFVFSGINTKVLAFKVPYVGEDGATFQLNVTLVTGVTLTFTYSSDEDASTLADSESIRLTIVDTQDESVQGIEFQLNNSTRTKAITVSSDSANRLKVNVPNGYYWAAWSNHEIITEGFGGRVDSTYVDLGKYNSSGEVEISVYKNVGITGEVGSTVGAGLPIESMTITGKNADGSDTYPVKISWNNETYDGNPLFEGYELSITLANGYSVFETAGLSGESPKYKILGTTDILLRCKVNTTWTIEISFVDGTSPIGLGVLVRNTEGPIVKVVLDGVEEQYDLRKQHDSFDDVTGTLRKTESGPIPSTIVCSFGGFEQHSPVKNGDTVHVEMSKVDYEVYFHGLSNSDIIHWDVFDGNAVPHTSADTAIDSDGNKIWLDSTCTTVIRNLDVSIFNSDHSLELESFTQLKSNHTWVDGEPIPNMVRIIVVTESDVELESGIDKEVDLGTEPLNLSLNGSKLTIGYNNGILNLHAEDSGTGSIVFEVGVKTVVLYIISDFSMCVTDSQYTGVSP